MQIDRRCWWLVRDRDRVLGIGLERKEYNYMHVLYMQRYIQKCIKIYMKLCNS